MISRRHLAVTGSPPWGWRPAARPTPPVKAQPGQITFSILPTGPPPPC